MLREFSSRGAFEPGEPFFRSLDRPFRGARRSNDDRALAAAKKLLISRNFIDETYAIAWHLCPSDPTIPILLLADHQTR